MAQEKNEVAMKDNGENTATNTGKPGMISRAASKIENGWMKFRTSRGGRWAIRGGKALLVGLGLYTAYDQGRKSVKPTVVYVTPEESEPETENQTEEKKEDTETTAE